MSLAPKLVSYWTTLLRKKRLEQDLSDELQAYLEELTERKIHSGLSPDVARREALMECHGLDQTKELVRETRLGLGLELWLKDIAYALRGFRRTPGFVLVVALTLALGIGAVTAMFSIVDAALLRKLAVDRPDELVLLGQPGSGFGPREYSESEFENIRRTVQSLSGIFAFAPLFGGVGVELDGQWTHVTGQLASGSYYSALGVRPFIGRMLTDADDRLGAEPAAVITYRYWKQQFKLDGSVIGRKVHVRLRPGPDIPVVIVGVSAIDFNGTSGFGASPDFTFSRTPMIEQQPRLVVDDGRLYGAKYPDTVEIMGRANPRVPREQITSEFRVKGIEAVALSGAKGTADLTQLLQSGPGRAPVVQLLAAAFALLLLIGCVNVSNLLFARSITRRREIGIRWILGASLSRLVRQLMVETVMLSFLGGGIGVLFAYVGQDLLRTYVLSLLPPSPLIQGEFIADLNPDKYILAFAAGISLLTGIVFGLALAFRTAKLDLHAAIKDEAAHSKTGRSRVGKSLLVAQ